MSGVRPGRGKGESMSRVRWTATVAAALGALAALAATGGTRRFVAVESSARSRRSFDHLLAAEAVRHGVSPSRWVMDIISREVATARAIRAADTPPEGSRAGEDSNLRPAA